MTPKTASARSCGRIAYRPATEWEINAYAAARRYDAHKVSKARLLRAAAVAAVFPIGVFVRFCAFAHFEIAGIVPFILLLLLGLRHLWIKSRKMLAANAYVTIANDRRPPCLYLRSFTFDGTRDPLRDPTQAFYEEFITKGIWILLFDLFVRETPTREQQLAETLSTIGPVVAIGRPGEDLPEVGANRLYCEDNQWQTTVTELMRQSQIVLLRPDDSAGLLWELTTALSVVDPDRIILDLCPTGELDSAVRRYLPVALPETLPRADFLYFDSDWETEKRRIPYRDSEGKRILR